MSYNNIVKSIFFTIISIPISLLVFYLIFSFFTHLFSEGGEDENIKKESVSVCFDRIYAFNKAKNKCFLNPFSYIKGRPPISSEIDGVFIDTNYSTKVSDSVCSCVLSKGKSFNSEVYVSYFNSDGKFNEIDEWLCFDLSHLKTCSWS